MSGMSLVSGGLIKFYSTLFNQSKKSFFAISVIAEAGVEGMDMRYPKRNKSTVIIALDHCIPSVERAHSSSNHSLLC